MDQLVVSYSKIKKWRFCRQSYFFNYVDRIVPKRKPKPLKLGSIVHSMLEAASKEEDWTIIHDQVKKEYSKMMEEEKEYYGDLPGDSKRIMEGYNKMYVHEKVSFHLIEKELGPVPLTSKTGLLFKVDRLMTDRPTKLTFLCETKTGRKIPQEEIRIWDLQTVLYVWALRKLGYKVDGVAWDYIRTKSPTIPELLKSGQLTRRKDIDTDWATYQKAIFDNELNLSDYEDMKQLLAGKENTFYRRVKIPVPDAMIDPIVEDARTTSLEIYYLAENPVKNISGYTCPRCSYSSLCYAQLRGLDEDFIRKAEFMNKDEEIEYGESIEEDSAE